MITLRREMAPMHRYMKAPPQDFGSRYRLGMVAAYACSYSGLTLVETNHGLGFNLRNCIFRHRNWIKSVNAASLLDQDLLAALEPSYNNQA